MRTRMTFADWNRMSDTDKNELIRLKQEGRIEINQISIYEVQIIVKENCSSHERNPD